MKYLYSIFTTQQTQLKGKTPVFGEQNSKIAKFLSILVWFDVLLNIIFN